MSQFTYVHELIVIEEIWALFPGAWACFLTLLGTEGRCKLDCATYLAHQLSDVLRMMATRGLEMGIDGLKGILECFSISRADASLIESKKVYYFSRMNKCTFPRPSMVAIPAKLTAVRDPVSPLLKWLSSSSDRWCSVTVICLPSKSLSLSLS